jgi:hypothetical protein
MNVRASHPKNIPISRRDSDLSEATPTLRSYGCRRAAGHHVKYNIYRQVTLVAFYVYGWPSNYHFKADFDLDEGQAWSFDLNAPVALHLP